jgi:hypothetical protein
MEKYDYTSAENLTQQTLEALDPSTGIGGFFERILGGGAIGLFAKGSNAAQVAANIRVLNARGYTDEAEQIQEKLDKYVKNNNLEPFKGIITGVRLEDDIEKQYGNTIFSKDRKVTSTKTTPTGDTSGDPRRGPTEDTSGDPRGEPNRGDRPRPPSTTPDSPSTSTGGDSGSPTGGGGGGSYGGREDTSGFGGSTGVPGGRNKGGLMRRKKNK